MLFITKRISVLFILGVVYNTKVSRVWEVHFKKRQKAQGIEVIGENW